MQKSVKSIVLGSLIVLGYSSFAVADSDVREACFEDLKGYLGEMNQYEEVAEELEGMEYYQLEDEFSRRYDNTSSFGVDLNEPLFNMRLYSFGEETAYQHPPYSPYPAYEKTEQWDEPVDEYVIIEEFVEDPDGEEHFMGCSFMEIYSEDLMEVKAENYWYDGDFEGVVVDDDISDNKIWYNQNPAYDYDDDLLAYFTRFFVFPEETQNEFFSKYPVKDVFPANQVSIDEFQDEFMGEPEELDEDEAEEVGITVRRDYGRITATTEDTMLTPMRHEADDDDFPLKDFYQEIENMYPEFAQYLAINGVVEFDVLKEVLDEGDPDELGAIWDIVFDTRDLEQYAYQREFEEETEYAEHLEDYYDEKLELVDNFDEEARDRLEIEETEVDEEEVDEEEVDEEEVDEEEVDEEEVDEEEVDEEEVDEEEVDEEEVDEEEVDEEEVDEEEVDEEEVDEEEVDEQLIIGVGVLVIIILLILIGVFVSQKSKKE